MSEGVPTHGDRGAWNVIDHGGEHANDINLATLRRHLPLPGALGGYARSNGTNWVRVDEAEFIGRILTDENGDVLSDENGDVLLEEG